MTAKTLPLRVAAKTTTASFGTYTSHGEAETARSMNSGLPVSKADERCTRSA